MADTTMIAKFSNSAEKQIFLNLSFPAENVMVKDRSGLVLDHKLVASEGNSLIYVTVPYDYLVFEMNSEFQTTKSGPEWDYLFSLSASENISSFSASLLLPKGAVLKSTNGAVTAGDSLELAWSSLDIDTAHKATMRASYELTRIEEDFTLFIIGGISALLIVIIAIYFLTKKKPTERPKTDLIESHSLFKTLDENEKEIVREVYRSKGKCTQAHLYLHTHIAKATLSRRIASLENRGILKKSQKGNRNLVTITDVFKE